MTWMISWQLQINSPGIISIFSMYHMYVPKCRHTYNLHEL